MTKLPEIVEALLKAILHYPELMTEYSGPVNPHDADDFALVLKLRGKAGFIRNLALQYDIETARGAGVLSSAPYALQLEKYLKAAAAGSEDGFLAINESDMVNSEAFELKIEHIDGEDKGYVITAEKVP